MSSLTVARQRGICTRFPVDRHSRTTIGTHLRVEKEPNVKPAKCSRRKASRQTDPEEIEEKAGGDPLAAQYGEFS